MTRTLLVVATLIGFALRVHALAAVTLRWDEGWSIAIAMLQRSEMFALTARDVHPPLYYLLLRPWLALLDVTEFTARFASVWASVLAIPLAAAAAEAWARPRLVGGGSGRRGSIRSGPVAAFLMAVAPALVYYAGVTRMYALTTPALLLAAWGLGRLALGGSARAPRLSVPTGAGWVGAVAGSLIALHTFYYTGFALAGLYLGGLLFARRRWLTLTAAAATACLYLPWLMFAWPLMATRLTRGGGTGQAFDWSHVLPLMSEGLVAALFAYRIPAAVVGVPIVILIAGLVVARSWLAARVGVAALAVSLVLVGAAAGAQAHMFAARYTIVATPFVVLAIAWAAGAIGSRNRFLGVLAVGAAILVNVPTLASYVYLRDAEVTEAFDPSQDWKSLESAAANDVAVFNILSLAGLYERYRGPADPPWAYAQLWDPVHEPLTDAQTRIGRVAELHERLWLVLYKGTYSPDSGILKAWADAQWFPATATWSGDRLIQSYATVAPDTSISPRATFDGGVRLERATYTARVRPGGAVAAELIWAAARRPASDARVFAHLYDASGALVAQQDGFPGADTRPPSSWPRGMPVTDRRGFLVPEAVAGPLTLAVGLYEPDTGRRWTLRGGADAVVVGTIQVIGPIAGGESARVIRPAVVAARQYGR